MRFFLPLLILTSFASAVWGQAASDAQIKTWIEELGADHYKVRQAAEDALRQQGTRVRMHVAPLLDSPDPEIRMRAERLLKTLGPNLLAFLKEKGTCKGEASEGKERWPCILTITEYNEEDGAFTGTIEWTSLDALHEIKGKLTQEAFTFRETGFIRRGNAIIGVDYTFPLNETKGSVLHGKWKSDTPRGGPAELKLP